MDLSGDEKQKKKKQSGAVNDDSIVGVLIDVFSAVMKTSCPNPQICELLMKSLIAIEERSSAEDWEPDITMEGTANFKGLLNRLAQLVLDDAQNPFLAKVLEAVLAKASKESVCSVSRENREKLLVTSSFAQHKKLMAVSREKKPAPKTVVAKAAPKPVAKKAVAPAPTPVNLAKKPAGKKMASKPNAKLPVAKTNPGESVLPVPTQQSIAASVSTCQEDLPKNLNVDDSSDEDGYFPPEGLERPIMKGSWADDSDLEQDDAGSKKSVEPYSLFFNPKVIVKSDQNVTVSDAAFINKK